MNISSLGKVILKNTSWLIIDKFLRLLAGVIIGIWVARYLGPEEFGLLSFARVFVGIFASLATLGMTDIIVRELTNHPQEKLELLGTNFGLNVLASLASNFFACLLIFYIYPDDKVVQLLVIIIASGFVFSVFNTIEVWFQSQIKSKLTVIGRAPAFIITSSLKIYLIVIEAPIHMFAFAGALEIAIGAIGLVFAYKFSGEKIYSWHYSKEKAKQLIIESWPLLLSIIGIALYMKMDQLMLKWWSGNSATGIYAAAVTISQAWYFVPVMLMHSLFPVLVKKKSEDQDTYYKFYYKIFRIMTVLSVTVAIIVSFIATPIIINTFGEHYSDAGNVLMIHIWTGVPVAIGVATTPWLINEGYSKIILQKTLFGVVLNILLNTLLIPQYGTIGVAIATLISQICVTYIWHVLDARIRRIGIMQIKSFNPFAANL